MPRPPLPLGTPGTITVSEDSPGAWVARCRFRDHDGVTRRLWKQGATKTAARGALHEVIQARQRGAAQTGGLTPASRFREAADLYLAKVDRKREDSTHALYAYHLNHTILPALGALQLRECSVARLDAFLEALEERYMPSTRRTLRSVVSGVLQVAVLHEALASNPVRELDRIEQPKGVRKKQPRGLTLDERRAFLDWLDGSSDDPRVLRLQKVARRAELPDLVRLGLGTGLRVGESLAVRRLDVNLDGLAVRFPDGAARQVPVVTIAGNVTWVKGKGLVRHDGKSDAALRVIPLPQFAVDVLRQRLDASGADDWPLFPTSGRDGQVTYRWPSNVRRTLRSVREEVGLGWMTPHTWRRTYATILDDEVTFTDRMKADLMGQAKFLKNTYVSRGELHAGAAVVLDAAISI